jgi:hypothetical protein
VEGGRKGYCEVKKIELCCIHTYEDSIMKLPNNARKRGRSKSRHENKMERVNKFNVW